MALGIPTRGSNENDLLKHNRSTLVKLLMKNGTCSRAQLAQTMHLTQAAISKITNNLISEGVIEEIHSQKGMKGRRIIPIQLKSDAFQFIGVRITWSYYFVGVFNISGDCCAYESDGIKDTDRLSDILACIVSRINQYCGRFPKIISAGVSVPSPYIGNEGWILQIGNEKQWDDVNVARTIRTQVDIPVYFKNDAKAGALAEWWFGNHQCKVLFHLLAGESLSSSIIVDGEPFVGAYGIAGEIGHMTIDYRGRSCDCAPESRGCLAEYCSAKAFLSDVLANIPYDSKLANLHSPSVLDVFQAAKEGDSYCSRKVEELGFYLGVAVANVINLFNPDVVVISDLMTNAGQPLLDAITKTVKGRIQTYVFERVSIEFSSVSRQWISDGEHGETAGRTGTVDTPVLGAVAVAIDMFLEDTSKYVKRDQKQEI
jgi:predicted NBD/HSP70 family sugar kinase